MCVALLVESERGPTRDELLAMELDNPHGGGISYVEGNRIRYHKGLGSRQIHKILAKVPRPCLVHFRWATHGGKAKHLTHPFPLGPRALVSKALVGTSDAVLIHNGVWYGYADYIPDWAQNRKAELSDTAVAAYVAERWEGVLDDVDWSNAVMRAAGRGRADITLRGRWVEHNGDMYSNLNWQSRLERWKSTVTKYPGVEDSRPTCATVGRTPTHSAYDDEIPWNYEEWIAMRDVPEDAQVEDGPYGKHDTEAGGRTYPPKDPRWTADGQLVEGGQVVPFDRWIKNGNRRETASIHTWLDEFEEVQRHLEEQSKEPK